MERFSVSDWAEEDVPGYYPQPHLGQFGTYEEAVAKADDLNANLGLGTIEGAKIVASSMRKQNRQKRAAK